MDDLFADLWGVLIPVEKRIVPPDPALLVEHVFAQVGLAQELLDLCARLAKDQLADFIVGSIRSRRRLASQNRQGQAEEERATDLWMKTKT